MKTYERFTVAGDKIVIKTLLTGTCRTTMLKERAAAFTLLTATYLAQQY